MGREDADKSRSAFRVASQQVAARVRLAVLREEDFVTYAGAFALDNPGVSNAALGRWVSQLRVFARYPELGGFGEIVLVPRSQLAAYARQAKADPSGSLGPRGAFSVVPPGARPYYCFAKLSAGRGSKGAPPAGFDFCAGDKGLMIARDSGRGTFFPHRIGSTPGLGVETPLYRGGIVPATVAARRRAFVAWIGLAMDPNVVLSAALQGSPHMAVVLRRSTGTSLASASLTFARGRIPPGARSMTVDLHDGSTVQTFALVAGASVFANGNSLLLLFGGGAMSLLLASLVFVLGTGRARALRLVGEKTGQLSFQAMHDALTGLPNRALVIDRAEQMLARARRHGSPVAALYVDVDNFKHVNDTFGHAAGDELLKVVAARLSGVVRGSDTVGRLGGDEFVALLEGDSLYAGPELVAERMLEALRQPIELEASTGEPVSTSASIGIAAGARANADELLRDADAALYKAKESGKDRVALFEERMQIALTDRRALGLDLSHALAHEELFLLYQPTFDLRTQLVTSVEALIRWRHPTRGVVLPDAFIPLAEETGLIVPIGRWVLAAACRQAASWRLGGHDVGVSVNVSTVQLERDQIVGEVRAALELTGLDADALTLEITETALIHDGEAVAARLRALKALGLRLAIDDFGTGYSSVASLRNFPIDALKIDRSFIADASSSRQSADLMHTLVQLGRTLGLETLGEGIEERGQLEQLRHEHCDCGQGFLFARPLDVEQLHQFLEREQAALAATRT